MLSIDIYCRVIDNFGDAGVCWRLARQLADEHRLMVRLIIDQPSVLARLVPQLCWLEPGQTPGEPQPLLQVSRWPATDESSGQSAGSTLIAPIPPDRQANAQVPDVLICAFGCDLPEGVRRLLAGAPPRPLWINLEYLSAERWVDSHHRLPSIKAQDGARQWFFFPGFRPGTGGLLRERSLLRARDRFREPKDASAPDHAHEGSRDWWHRQGLPGDPGLRLSCFCYPDAPLSALQRAVAHGCVPATLVLPGSLPPSAAVCTTGEQAQLTLARMPLLPIDDFDRLLWSCDLNLVRGEDSWIRALWAGRPFIWQPYRQPEQVHRDKLEAFLAWQRDALEASTAGVSAELEVLEAFSRAWSEADAESVERLFPALLGALGALRPAFEQLALAAAAQPDLAAQLVEFCRSRL